MPVQFIQSVHRLEKSLSLDFMPVSHNLKNMDIIDVINTIMTTMSIGQMYGASRKALQQTAIHSVSLFLANNWEKYRQIYSFDPEMISLLPEFSESETIPVEILSSLPVPFFFLEPENAFIALSEAGTDDRCKEWYLTYQRLKKDDTGAIAVCETRVQILSSGMTIGEIVQEKEGLNSFEFKEFEQHEELKASKAEFLKRILPQLLYLCAQNADLTETTPDLVKEKRKKVESTGKTYVPKTPVTFDVGHVIVRDYNKSKNVVQSGNRPAGSSSGWTQRPHVRRGHWHHFWTGKRTDPESRKLILKWIAPLFVNANVDQDVPETINNVR